MRNTLQEQYNAIKGGKGNKEQFLRQARDLFPQYITKFLDFDTSSNVLKSKQIISEILEAPKADTKFNIFDWKKSLLEKPIESENGVIKNDKSKDELNKNAFDNKDTKNIDNINFNEILKGFYAELKDDKNHGKTAEELRDIAVKNLTKDPLHYTKDGMFGEKGVGFKEAEEIKEPKGKYKSSGYGDLDSKDEPKKEKSNVKDTLSNSEAKTTAPKKVKEMSVTPQNSKGVKKFDTPGKEKIIKLKEGLSLSELLKEDEELQEFTNNEYTGDGEPDETVMINKIIEKDSSYKKEELEKLGFDKIVDIFQKIVVNKLNEINESEILPPTEVKVGMDAYYDGEHVGAITDIFQNPEFAEDVELPSNTYFVEINEEEIGEYGVNNYYCIKNNGGGDNNDKADVTIALGKGGERAPKEEEPNKEKGKISHWVSKELQEEESKLRSLISQIVKEELK